MRHNQYTIIVTVSLLILAGSIFPQRVCAQQVRAGAAYLKILPGTRQQGVSGSMTAGLDEAFSIYSNPGATGMLREWQFAMSYTKWIADINNASLFAGKSFDFNSPFGRNIYAGLGLNSQGVDVQSTNGLAPTASARDVLVTGTLGIPLNKIFENLSFGTNIKYLNSSLDVASVSSLLFDIGLLYRTQRFDMPLLPFDGILSLGGSVNHLGKSLQFQNLKTPLPRVYRFGAGLNLGNHDGLQLQLVGDFRRIRDEADQYGFGLEVINFMSAIPMFETLGLDNRFGRFLTFRLGWLENDKQDKNILDGFSYGFSLSFDDFMNYRAKSGNGGLAATNSAWRLDMATQSNASITGDVSHFGGTYIPNGPESFEFRLDENFMTTDTTGVDFNYELGERVELAWQASRDPDLYDDVNYIVLVAKERPVLERMLASPLFENRVNEPFFTDPDTLLEVVEYHQATRETDHPAEFFEDHRSFFINKNGNHISYSTARQVDSAKVEFLYFFPHRIKTEKYVDLSNIVGEKPYLRPDSTFRFSKPDNQYKYSYRPTLDNCYHSGDFYWSVIAYDKNFHQRVIEGENSSIAHFRVIGRPDLTININRVDSVIAPLPETFSLEDVHFAFGKADTSDLYPASKDTLQKWVDRLNEASYDSIMVYGYTDATGPEEFNQQLSRDRAESIVTYLKRHGIRSIYFRPVGFGETALLPREADESLLAWNRRNRRVRMRVVKEPPPKKYFARLDITNVGQVESPAGFAVNVFNQTDNFTEKPVQVAMGAPAMLVTPFELDVAGEADAVLASKVPGFIAPDLAIYPDTSNFRFDTLSVHGTTIMPDTTFEIPAIACGETVSLLTTWNERNRFLVAVVDQLNKIDEVKENNNWDIERLLSTDLEISKKIARIQPLRIDANFETNRDSLNRAGQQDLMKQPLDELKLALDALDFQNTYLEIGGHTDDRGSDAYNNDLSFRRAKWIKNFLVMQFNFDSTRISAVGYGESNPLHDSVGFRYAKFSPEWAAKHKDNRRIELRWLQNETGIAPEDRICNATDCVANDRTVRAAFVGQKIDYQLTVRNLSTNAADRVKIVDMLPQYFKLENGSVNSSVNAAFSTRWDTLSWIADIAAGDSAAFSYTVELTKNFVNMIQKLENKATVVSQLDYNTGNNSDSTSITGIGNIVSDSQVTQPDENVHIVRCGEYLSTIALMYYGNAARYDTISKTNNISNPDRIEAGDRLKIPAAKMKTTIDPDSVYVDISGAAKVGAQLRAYLRYKKNNRIVPYNVSYNWLRNGSEINESCADYQIKPQDSNQKITVEIIVDAAKGLVFRGDLQSVVENKPPVVSNVGLEGSRCVEGILHGVYDYDDPEGDPDRSQFKWFRNDQIIATSTENRYTVTTADVGATIKFGVIPGDGFAQGSLALSPEVLIPLRVEDEADCELAPISISQN